MRHENLKQIRPLFLDKMFSA